MKYWPNPAHKAETTEAGPPAWSPDKEKCPRGMTVAERDKLLAESLPVNEQDPRSRRFVLRRTTSRLEVYDIKYSGWDEGDEPVFHAHPANRIDRAVLKLLRDRRLVSEAEYHRLARELPGC